MQRRAPARNQHWAEVATRKQRVPNIATWLAAAVTFGIGVLQMVTGVDVWRIGFINLGTATIFLLIPLLHRFGEIVAPLTFVFCAYFS